MSDTPTTKLEANKATPQLHQRRIISLPHDANGMFRLFDATEFICGWGAAFINIAVTFPVYKLIFRQMLHGVNSTSAFNQIRHEGFSFLYRGIFPPLAQKTVSLSVMFGIYDGTHRPLVNHYDMNVYVAKVIGGMTAGTVEAILMPFERVQTLLADSKYHSSFRNTVEAFAYVWGKYGFKECYRGLHPILYRNGPSNALFFLMREETAVRLPVQSENYAKFLQEFAAGALIGALLSSIFYPLNVTKVVIQSTMGTPYISVAVAFRQIYNDRGRSLRNVYRGCGVNCSRAFLSWGIMNTAYEHIKRICFLNKEDTI